MPAQTEDAPMPALETRDDYVDYLESEAAGAEPTGARLRTNLVKSYVLETVREGSGAPNAAATFADTAGLQLTELDGGAIYTLAAEDGIVAVIEGAETRFPVLHSTRKAQVIDPLVKGTVLSSPWLDHIWLPGRFFDALWSWTRDTVDPGRLAKLKFSYTGKYERLDLPGPVVDDNDLDVDEELVDVDEDGVISEVRQSQFEVSDRVGVLDARLEQMRNLYDPLQSTVQIRIPSTVRGGHEVYSNGKITNRSVSFAEQQKIIRLVTNLYRRVTEDAEEKLWYSADEEIPGDGAGFAGRPVYLHFPERLELSTLHWWADRTFGIKRNIFRLGGQPMWSGPDRTRLHVYGVDRHLWQPVSIEVTRDHMLAVLPAGTCGNTINRLVTNVQRYLSPSVKAWIGAFPYEELLLGSTEAVA